MDFLSKNEIEKVVEQYASTPEGRNEIKKRLGSNKRLEFVPRFSNPPMRTMIEHAKTDADLMKNILWKHITKDTRTDGRDGLSGFPKDAIVVSNPTIYGDGQYIKIDIYFDANAIRRESLRPDLYPDGVTDIISLFVHGYDARNHVYGEWHGNSDVWSLTHRDPNAFMANAVDEYNKSKADGSSIAVLMSKYQ